MRKTGINRPITGVLGAVPGIGVAPTSFSQVADGKYTSTIYTLIRDGRFADAIKLLYNQLQLSPKSRAALSLLGYCYYQNQAFADAADWYTYLMQL